jgi:hypothetical protein
MTGASRARSVADGSLRVAVAAALSIDAVEHIRLAPGYQLANPGGIGQGTLFYLESGAAIVAALYVLARGSRPAYLAAALVAGSALAAVLVTRYIGTPAIGPIPAMYEPTWYFEKSLSALAEGLGLLLALVGWVVRPRRGRRR